MKNLKFVKIENNSEWDKRVLFLSQYSFLNSSNRFEFLKDSGKEIFKYGIYKNDEYLGIVSGYIGKSKLFGNYLDCKHSPLLTENRKEYWEELFDFCEELSKQYKCFMYRFSPLYERNEILSKLYHVNGFIKAPIHNVDALITQHFDVSKTEENLKHDMSSSTRNNVNKLLKNPNVTIKVFNDNSQLSLLGNFYEQTKRHKKYRGSSSEELLRELELQIKANMCYLIVGYFKNKPISIWQATVFGNNVHIYQSCSDTEFRENNVRMTYLLFWESFKLAKKLGCKTLDLFGGMTPVDYQGEKHPWKGVNSFKESLGGRKITYMHSRDYPINKLKYYVYYIYSYLITTRKGYTVRW